MSSIKLLPILNRLFQAQARDAMSKVSLDRGVPDMSAWIKITADAVRPVMLRLHQEGMVRAAARIAAKVGAEPVQSDQSMRRIALGNEAVFGPRVEMRQIGNRVICKAKRLPGVPPGVGRAMYPTFGMDFNLFEPKVLDAVDSAVYAFCRETMETAVSDWSTSLEQLRLLMREGLPRGDAVQLLAKKTREVFADPARAFRIATTETSRAMHGGARMAARESGVVTGFQWLSSVDSCKEVCIPLNGKQVKDGEPYLITSGKPPYNIIWHPPAHPHCQCDETEIIGELGLAA